VPHRLDRVPDAAHDKAWFILAAANFLSPITYFVLVLDVDAAAVLEAALFKVIGHFKLRGSKVSTL